MEVIDISLPAMRRVDAEVPSAIMGGETEVGAVDRKCRYDTDSDGSRREARAGLERLEKRYRLGKSPASA